jgi:hypothetical protein
MNMQFIFLYLTSWKMDLWFNIIIIIERYYTAKRCRFELFGVVAAKGGFTPVPRLPKPGSLSLDQGNRVWN